MIQRRSLALPLTVVVLGFGCDACGRTDITVASALVATCSSVARMFVDEEWAARGTIAQRRDGLAVARL